MGARKRADEATVILGPDGHFENASPGALALLGLALHELRGRSPRALMAMDRAESEALSETWRSPVPKAAGGEATIRRPDGATLRVRFLLRPLPADRHEVVLAPLATPPSEHFVVYSLPELIARWRAAERRLAAAMPGSDECVALREEIEAFRGQYQALHDAKRRQHANDRQPDDAHDRASATPI